MAQGMAHLRQYEGLHGGHYQEIPAWGQSQSELVTIASGSAIGDRPAACLRFSSACVHRFSFVAAVSLRFDIAQAVNKVARHMAAPTEKGPATEASVAIPCGYCRFRAKIWRCRSSPASFGVQRRWQPCTG